MTSENTSANTNDELDRQEKFPWRRGDFLRTYELVFGECTVKSVLEHSKSPSLLDVACGNGLLTKKLAPHFERVVGLDASSQHIAEAKQDSEGVEFVHGLAEEYEGGERFSTITAIHLLEHVIDPVNFIKEVAGNLEDHGVFIAQVPNALAVNRRIASLMGSLEDEYELSPFDKDVVGHRRNYDMKTLITHFEQAGLKVIEQGGVFYKMLSSPQINWLLEKGPWDEGGYGWGRVGKENSKDWRKAFCDACYEFGKESPEDCNGIYVVAKKE